MIEEGDKHKEVIMEWFKKTTTCATPLEESHGSMITKQIYAIFVGQFKTY